MFGAISTAPNINGIIGHAEVFLESAVFFALSTFLFFSFLFFSLVLWFLLM